MSWKLFHVHKSLSSLHLLDPLGTIHIDTTRDKSLDLQMEQESFETRSSKVRLNQS